MRAFVGARGPKLFGLRTFGGLSGHVTIGGVFTWLLVVGVAELAVVIIELALRLVKVVAVSAWAALDWTVKRIRQHRQAMAARLADNAGGAPLR
jgi:hypothetical protein